MNTMIDWKKVRKECKKLKIYDGHFNPSTVPFEQQCWNVTLSTRNNEKTTGYVLLGMVLYRMYGVRLEYCRLLEDDIRPKDHRHFFDSIISYGYIEKLTDGKYNSVTYKAGFWFYQHVDSNGIVDDVDVDPFMHVFAIRKAMDMKSNYTSNAVFIIFDEFIDPTKIYKDDFVLLCDCVSTIFRNRYGWVNLLANTLDRQSVWFKEMCISREVSDMKLGESKRIAKDDLTPVLVNILPSNITQAKQKHNLALFNFKNSKLEAITGTTEGWSMRIYPRLPKSKNEYLLRNIYINVDGFISRIDVVNNATVGLCLHVVDTDVPDPLEYKEDALLLTTDFVTRDREIYLFSNKKISSLLNKCMNANKVYFSSNESGITFDHFLQQSHYWANR